MADRRYFLKFLALFLFTFANVFFVWNFMIKGENSDWITSKIEHQTSPYAVTEDSRGLTVNNGIMGYGFKVPKGFKTAGARNLSFFLEENGRKECEIKHYYVNADKVSKLSSDGGKTVFLLDNVKLVFELTGTEAEKNLCAKYLKQIEDSIVAN